MNNAVADSPLQQFDFGELFPGGDRLADVTAHDVGPEIAVALGLPSAPPVVLPRNVIAEVENFIRRFCVMRDAAYLPLATWVVATHVSNAFDAFPYIALVSPAKRCGKTRVLEVLELLCAGAWRGTSPSSAALYRMMASSPTLLLDEVEALRGKKVSEMQQAILAVLNAGHRKGATVPRCDGPKNEVKHFPVYGPKAFAAIGGLPDTLADRCVCITMQRKTESQKVDRFLSAKARMDANPIRVLLEMWAQEQEQAAEMAYTGMGDLDFLRDRDADLWMPLFAVCAVAAPERVGELKVCALALTGAKAADDLEDSPSLKLLADVRNILTAGCVHIATSALLGKLKEIPESPWAEPELTDRKLAWMLRPFDVRSRQIRIGTSTVKGYLRTQLEDAFSRYLPSQGTPLETNETTRMDKGENEDS
jgi:hypothetical protein